MRRSKVLEKLRNDEPVLCTNINAGVLPLLMEMAGKVGIDAVWIDMEHRDYSWSDVKQMVTAGRLADIDSMVRIRKGEGYTTFFRPLEDGAAGIMVPHVTTADEARDVIRNAKFAPEGLRGLETVMQDADCSLADAHEYMQHANRETFIAIQIEDREGVDAIDEIAAVAGIDIFFIGIGDLTQSYGKPLDFENPQITDAISKISAAAARNNVHWGMPCRSVEHAGELIDRGARFISLGADIYVMAQFYQKLHGEFHDMLKKRKG